MIIIPQKSKIQKKFMNAQNFLSSFNIESDQIETQHFSKKGIKKNLNFEFALIEAETAAVPEETDSNSTLPSDPSNLSEFLLSIFK